MIVFYQFRKRENVNVNRADKKEARASIKAVYLPSSFVKTLSNIFFYTRAIYRNNLDEPTQQRS